MLPCNEKKSLSVFGIGPVYALPVIVSSFLSFFMFEDSDWHLSGTVLFAVSASGACITAYGFHLWFRAVFISKMISHIKNNQLMTDGVYAVVRNPVYSGVLFGCSGAVFISGNAVFFPLPLFYWLYLNILVRFTEERWLYNLYGEPYLRYCGAVPRCIPRLSRLF
jgi:protein-S-isoprenylcysteine O-methyltransferase Ste14